MSKVSRAKKARLHLVPAMLLPNVRTCLMCGEEFKSSFAGNRRCPQCTDYVVEEVVWEERVYG